MGSASINVSRRGTSMEEAFESARKEAEEEYGSDRYNGEINNADCLYDWTKKYNGKNLDKLSEEAFDLDKGTAVGICLKPPKPNKNKTKSEVKRTPQKGARKWVTKYLGTGWEGNHICEADTLTDCIKKARAHTEKTQERVVIKIVKRLVEGNHNCAIVSYKKSRTEELGLYKFFGRVNS